MFKKVFPGASIVLASLCYAGIAQAAAEPVSTISFQKTSQMIVKSDTALVNVVVNATALKDDSQIIQKAALQNLTSIIPKVDWKVIDFKEFQADSGAQNIKLVIQTRLTSSQIKTLKAQLKNNNSNNSRFQVDVVSFAPSSDMIDKAKDDMMIKMYQSIQNYVKTFNQQTGEDYVIKNVSFNIDAVSPQSPRMMTYFQTKAASNDSNQEQEVSVSKKIMLNADVQLSESLKPSDQKGVKESQLVSGMGMLPPKYLEVKDYQKCLQTRDNGSWQSWCLPQQKPKDCPQDSWDALSAQNIPDC
ncbi:hypothetical protein [Facilibium subflavum]|uniref:hypothetical protein n=1 Tax=Facilibium subflavum TaxID=2219058 RepID=UPI000E657C33|nr:hypothetical protein [Facilibium subflavum]